MQKPLPPEKATSAGDIFTVYVRFVLNIGVTAAFIYLAYQSLAFAFSARIAPLTFSLLGSALGIANLLVDISRYRRIGPAFVGIDTGALDSIGEDGDDVLASEYLETAKTTRRESRLEVSFTEDIGTTKSALGYLLWVISLPALIYVFGSWWGIGIFLVLFMHFIAKDGIFYMLFALLGVFGFLRLVTSMMPIRLPRGLFF